MRTQSKALFDRLVTFGIDATFAARTVRAQLAGEHLATQLVRAATSVGANYAEACEAESRADFLHKMQVCLKELRECEMRIRTACGVRDSVALRALAKECDELIAIFVASVRTAKLPPAKSPIAKS